MHVKILKYFKDFQPGDRVRPVVTTLHGAARTKQSLTSFQFNVCLCINIWSRLSAWQWIAQWNNRWRYHGTRWWHSLSVRLVSSAMYQQQVTWLVVTEVRSTSFWLVLHAPNISANSFNFLITWGLHRSQFSIPRAYFVYTVWHSTGQHCSSMYVCMYRLLAGKWHPLVSVITTLYYVVKSIFHCWVWYRALSLCYACIWSSGIILTC